MERKVLCYIYQQGDSYELFTTVKEFVEWCQKFDVPPAEARRHIVVHYLDTPRVFSSLNIDHFIEECQFTQEQEDKIFNEIMALHQKWIDSLGDESVKSQFRLSPENLRETAREMLKYRWKII